MFLKLKKELYGLKKAPRAWYAHIDNYLMKFGLRRRNFDPVLYFKVVQDMSLIFVLYVHDIFLIGSDPLMIKCKREIPYEFEMKDLRLMHLFIGLEVCQRFGEIFLSHEKYVEMLLERFGIIECKSFPTPMEMNFKRLGGEVVGPNLVNPSKYI